MTQFIAKNAQRYAIFQKIIAEISQFITNLDFSVNC